MAKVTRVYSFSTGDIIQATNLNVVFDTIYNEFNGNIDDANIKENANIDGSKLLNGSITYAKLAQGLIADSNLDYSSIKVLRVGPNISNNGIKSACGSKGFTYAAGVVTITITFSTDADAGNPQFSAPPRVTLGIRQGSGTDRHSVKITEIRASGFSAELRSSNVGDTSSGNLDWIAEGNV